MSEKVQENQSPLWKRILFSQTMVNKSTAKRIAYTGVACALCIVTNLFEIKFFTVQFSLTIFSSVLAGIFIGPLFGFCAVFLGDGIGYMCNGMGAFPYYWWVALACATMALLSGLLMNVPLKCRGAVYIKLALVCVATFFLCSVLINSLGMYYLGLPLYMPPSVKNAIDEYFGGNFSFGIYLLIRFFILGQIYNSVVNYAILFAVLPALKAIKPLDLNIR